jgi:hypothetical protein
MSDSREQTSDDGDDGWLTEFPVDGDYIDVETRTATLERSDDYRYDASHTFDRSDEGGTGTARDVEIDRKRVIDRDDRGRTRTGFDPADAEEGEMARTVYREGKKWVYAQWLRTLQNGYRDSDRDIENSSNDRESYVDVFCSRLDMTPYQQKRVQSIVDSVNMKHMAHYPTEIVVMAIISVVANEDDRWIREEDMFKELVRDLDGSMQAIKNARILVKRKSDLI